MTDHTNDSNDDAQASEAGTQSASEADQSAARAVSRGALGLFALLLLTLVWYLMAGRFTPYTSQARVQGYVVGVAPKVAGVITEVWVQNNARVEEGQRLFAIDRSQYEIALQKARSDLDNARQQVQAGDAAVEQARAGLRAAQAGELKAWQDYTRLKRLREDDPGTISERRLEISEASLEQARAQVASAEAQIQRAIEQKGGDTEDSNTLLQVARSGVEKAQLDLDNTTVVAQSAGVITDLRAEAGQFAGTGHAVLTLIALEDVWINAEFTENNLGHLAPGTPVEIVLDALPGRVLRGRVRSVGVGVSAGAAPPPGGLPSVQNDRDWLRQAQRFPVRVEFQESIPADVLRQLRIGGQASVIAYTEGHGLLAALGKLYIRLLSYLSFAY
ncbi:HlyD family secretion protein [Parahaliea mediterranea]|uniref:HlyD family secretion protein n=1 Tax=Parahaliea mediterranea TaxID=651086 RepID=A0A939DFS1_9GAMM|nr:HlyD family secretion protein [Parahaliea mediterranea]MBN7796707.1 HlyD family secretion protein [Parahaliea mediterranea]